MFQFDEAAWIFFIGGITTVVTKFSDLAKILIILRKPQVSKNSSQFWTLFLKYYILLGHILLSQLPMNPNYSWIQPDKLCITNTPHQNNIPQGMQLDSIPVRDSMNQRDIQHILDCLNNNRVGISQWNQLYICDRMDTRDKRFGHRWNNGFSKILIRWIILSF